MPRLLRRHEEIRNRIDTVMIKKKIAAVLLALFGADFVYSHFNPNTGEGITDYGYKEDGQCLLRADSSSGHIQRLN